MFLNLFKVEKHSDSEEVKAVDKEGVPILNMTYKPVSMTIELRRREHEEYLRKLHNVPKEKYGTIL